MQALKNVFRTTNRLIKDNLFVLLLLVGFSWWLWPTSNLVTYNESRGHASKEESMAVAYNMSDSISTAAPRMAKMARGMIAPPIAAADFDPEATERKIIKNASLQLEVDNTEEGKTLVEAEIEILEGFVTHQNSWEVRPGTLAYNMTIRIPADKLETLIKNLTKLGVKKSENYSTSDITAAYSDTENKIKNLEARRNRLRELMQFKTDSLNDVLQIDRELSNVQNQIENLERTQKRRDTNVDYSTLQLSLNPEPEIGDFSSPNWNLERSWKEAVNDFLNDARQIVNKGLKIIVYTPIWLPLLLILLWVRRRFFRRK